jgi:hypothetical protein
MFVAGASLAYMPLRIRPAFSILVSLAPLVLAAALGAQPAHAARATIVTKTAAGVATAPRGGKATQIATVAVIEFYNASQDHYFITGAPQEIADLDAGLHAGWQRTGLSFNAYASDMAGATPVCRFYIPPALGDSHFFSASPVECLQTRTRFPDFDLESDDAFEVVLPDAVTGACPAETVAVYRLWNTRADTNHRYTTDRVVWQHMQDLGWRAEGYGPQQVAMCAPRNAIATVDVAVVGRAVIKARVAGDVVALLEERPTSIFEDGPDRTLALLQPDGRSTRTYTPPAGWSLADFAVHPSGDVSLVLTTARAVRLQRMDRNGNVRSDRPFADAAAARDRSSRTTHRSRTTTHYSLS